MMQPQEEQAFNPFENATNLRQYRALPLDHETYTVISADETWGRAWDITYAKEIAARHLPVTLPVEPPGGLMEQECKSRVDDPAYALSEKIDLSFPIIAVPFEGSEGGTHHVIDGWNRYYKAMRTGVRYLMAVFLTEEEERACRLLDFDIER